jgi:glycosyltransferase involved in cell wall biosynthesis
VSLGDFTPVVEIARHKRLRAGTMSKSIQATWTLLLPHLGGIRVQPSGIGPADPQTVTERQLTARPLRLGIVAVSHMDPWDLRIFSRLASFGIVPTLLGPLGSDASVPTARVESARNVNPWRRIRVMEQIGYKIHGFAWDRGLGRVLTPFGLDDAVVGFSRIAREFDVLQVFETYRASSYQACRDHPAVVVKVTENIPFNPRMWPYNWFRGSVRRRARRFVCVSESARAALLQEGFDEDRIRLIPEPVDTAMFHPADSPIPAGRPFTVGYAAKLDWAHGLPDLLQAFAFLSKSVDARLQIVGEGRLAPILGESLRQLGIEDRVLYVGKVRYEEMPAFLHGVDALCVPSREVPGWKPQFGIVNIEAMACGIPIVATRAGATPEIVPPGLQGFLASPGGHRALAESLATLASDSALRERLGREAREWVVQRYDAARVAAQWGSLFSEVASEVGRR